MAENTSVLFVGQRNSPAIWTKVYEFRYSEILYFCLDWRVKSLPIYQQSTLIHPSENSSFRMMPPGQGLTFCNLSYTVNHDTVANIGKVQTMKVKIGRVDLKIVREALEQLNETDFCKYYLTITQDESDTEIFWIEFTLKDQSNA